MSDSNLKNQWDSSPSVGDPVVRDRIWRRVSWRLARRKRLWSMTAAAAVAAIVTVAGLRLGQPLSPSDQGGEAPREFLVSAPLGTRSRVALPDGTTVVINAGSTLAYSSDFNKGSRDVSLTGEAYFEVERNPDMPFRVIAGDCVFAVLGTKFNISAYPGDPAVEGTLLEGSLRFESGGDGVLIIPGQQLSFEEGTYSLKEVDAAQYCSWVTGSTRFDSIRLDNLCRRLSRAYDVEIVLEPGSLEERSVRVSFTKEDSIETIMKTLVAILPVRISREGRAYHIRENS